MSVFGAIGSVLGSVAQGIFNSNQASKNRAFQERMYEKQKQDNIDFWKMQQDYNLPSAVLQRMRDAGLNPLMMYEGGAGQLVANSQVQKADAPSGSQAQGFQTNFGQALQQDMLLKAQIADINAGKDLKLAQAEEARSRAKGQDIQNQVSEATKDLQIAKASKDIDLMNQSIEWLATQDFALTNMTAANLENIASIIDFREKYYNLDKDKVENQIWYNIESIALGKQHVSLELKRIAVDWYDAITKRKEVLGKLNVFREQVKNIAADTELTEQEKSNKILDAYHTVLENDLLEGTGTDDLGSLGGLILLLTGNISGRIGEKD